MCIRDRAVTDDGTANGKLLGIVASRDYRISRMSTDLPVREFMTPFEKLVVADEDTTLKEANDIIWDNKINSLPLIDQHQHRTRQKRRLRVARQRRNVLQRRLQQTQACLLYTSSVSSSSIQNIACPRYPFTGRTYHTTFRACCQPCQPRRAGSSASTAV